MRGKTMLIAAAVIALLATSLSASETRTDVRIYAVKDRFENVKDDVMDAIVKRGFVVDFTARIGAMLARTAKDVGATRKIYEDAQAFQFCSATLARRIMEADPANIAFCPHIVFVYALAGAPETTYVGYRPLPRVGSPQTQEAVDAVNAMLEAVVREAAGRK